jgi:hypothetical protein
MGNPLYVDEEEGIRRNVNKEFEHCEGACLLYPDYG